MTLNPHPAIAYLRKLEWSAGNGQCHECWGGPKAIWEGHPCWSDDPHSGQEPFGHKPDCPLAASLEGLGETVERVPAAHEHKA